MRCLLHAPRISSTLTPSFFLSILLRAHCESVNAARVLSAPDFGKIIKCVFPYVKARRLGTRGNSKYPFHSEAIFQERPAFLLKVCLNG